MIRRLFIIAAAASVLLSPGLALAQSTEVAGVRFEPGLQVGGTRRQLNGAGVRYKAIYKAIYKVNAAGVYLSAKATTPEAVLAASGPRHLQIGMLREIDANELGKLFTRGMEQNASRDDFSKSIAGMMHISDIGSSRKKRRAGDSFAVEWTSGIGHRQHHPRRRQASGRADQGAGVLRVVDEDLARQSAGRCSAA